MIHFSREDTSTLTMTWIFQYGSKTQCESCRGWGENDASHSCNSCRKSQECRGARLYKVHRKSLNRRLTGGKTREAVREEQQILFEAEETVLRRWCTQLTVGEFSCSYMVLKEMAEVIMQQWVTKINDAIMSLVKYPAIGIQWPKWFTLCRPTLKNVRSNGSI